MSLEIYKGRLWDWSKGRSFGIADNGPYGVRVLDDFGHKVGTLSRETMCNASFLTFEKSKPLAPFPSELPRLMPSIGEFLQRLNEPPKKFSSSLPTFLKPVRSTEYVREPEESES